MTQFKPLLLGGLVIALLVIGMAPVAIAQPGPGASALRVVSRIAGPDGSWDYASFDPAHNRVYVAHGDVVMAIDAATDTVTPAFAAGDHLHAVVAIPGSDVLLTTNSGDNSVRFLNGADGKLLKSLNVAADADGAVYDPSSGLVVVINGEPGIVTLVDPVARKVAGTIKVAGALEYPAVDGNGRLYVNVEDKGQIVVIDIARRELLATYPLAGCTGPTGLAYVEGGRLISACASKVAKIIDAASGREIASLTIGGHPDAVIYDPTRQTAFVPCALDGTLAVIALAGPANNSVIDRVSTQIGARTGALDPKTGRLYLPTAEYVLPVPAGQRPTTKPGTFKVLVLDRH